jgi:hypothetical protein
MQEGENMLQVFIKDAAVCRKKIKVAAYRRSWLGSCMRATRAPFFIVMDAKLFFVVNSMPRLCSLSGNLV